MEEHICQNEGRREKTIILMFYVHYVSYNNKLNFMIGIE